MSSEHPRRLKCKGSNWRFGQCAVCGSLGLYPANLHHSARAKPARLRAQHGWCRSFFGTICCDAGTHRTSDGSQLRRCRLNSAASDAAEPERCCWRRQCSRTDHGHMESESQDRVPAPGPRRRDDLPALSCDDDDRGGGAHGRERLHRTTPRCGAALIERCPAHACGASSNRRSHERPWQLQQQMAVSVRSWRRSVRSPQLSSQCPRKGSR